MSHASFDPDEHPHRRHDPLADRWVVVSPHRAARPWQGQVESPAEEDRPSHDPGCHLCPGNTRASGVTNPAYEQTLVFTNDFPALLPDAPAPPAGAQLFRWSRAAGTCRVLCYSPRHDLTFAELPLSDLERVVDVWADQVAELSRRYLWVQVFENKGALMGASSPHPHGQVWALDALPSEAAREATTQAAYLASNGTPLLLDYAGAELERGERVVAANDHWLAVVPFWATWPFELLIVPHARVVARLPDLDVAERAALAALCKDAFVSFDNLFATSFPYTFGWHGAPSDADADAGWQLHAHVYPPLLRSATVRKFMVGFETLAEPQRDITPETAASRLRAAAGEHYRSRT